MNEIISYAHIKRHQVIVNGEPVFKANAELTNAEFLSEAYKATGMSYPKFHKMDALCKLGVLGAEFVLKDAEFLKQYPLDKIAIVLSNKASSLETDRSHQHSINDKANYFPSPAVFVYTLPNIVIGEIAIRYKITGENAFFVSETLDAGLLVNYLEMLFKENTEAALCGWVEVDGDDYEAFIFLAQKSKQNYPGMQEDKGSLEPSLNNEITSDQKLYNINKNSNFKPLNQLSVITLFNQTTWTHS